MTGYNHLNKYLKDLFGVRTLKICINGGFTCPNRDGTKGTNGCAFCSNGGSLVNGNSLLTIKEQVNQFLSSYKGERADAYIAYFQEYTNTYAPIDVLKQKYDEALNSSDKFVALDIDTRPDCINEEVVELLHSYQDKYHVFVELGLQTSNEETHKRINQNISNNDFINAVKLLKKYNIEIVVHIMVGLPGESHQDIVNTINFVNDLDINGIKIHSTYVLKGTQLEKMYLSNEYIPLTVDDYISEVIYVLSHISPKVVIHRITGDAPEDSLLAPSFAKNKKLVMNEINNLFQNGNIYQGKYYKI